MQNDHCPMMSPDARFPGPSIPGCKTDLPVKVSLSNRNLEPQKMCSELTGPALP